jgi:hypothetical protein
MKIVSKQDDKFIWQHDQVKFTPPVKDKPKEDDQKKG